MNKWDTITPLVTLNDLQGVWFFAQLLSSYRETEGILIDRLQCSFCTCHLRAQTGWSIWLKEHLPIHHVVFSGIVKQNPQVTEVTVFQNSHSSVRERQTRPSFTILFLLWLQSSTQASKALESFCLVSKQTKKRKSSFFCSSSQTF